MRVPLLLLSLLAALPAPAHAMAQLGGGLHLPSSLPAGLPSSLPGAVGGLTGALDQTVDRVETATQARLNTIDTLLHQHGDVLERSPQGDLIVRNQVVSLSPSPEALTQAQALGFVIAETTTLDGLGTTVVVLTAPRGVSTREALKRLRKADPTGSYDFNDIYLGSQSGIGSARPALSNASGGGRVGLIDGGVDTGHPVFRGAHIVQKGFAGAAVPSAHGTATASLLAGRSDGFAGAAPGGELIVADVYGNSPTGGSTTAIVRALDWMAQQQVAVINISLVGPPNDPLKLSVATLVKRGYLIVAAVGNDGPAAKPLYPAAFDGVVGVTGVDRRDHVLPEAGRGPQVRFAAPGADIAAAGLDGSFTAVRGTSFAAPIVAGLLARSLAHPDPQEARAAVASLAATAVDLGSKGVDTTYGNGLVGKNIRIDIKVLSK